MFLQVFGKRIFDAYIFFVLSFQPQVTEISEEEWANAKEYKEIPGPSAIGLMLDFLPGGRKKYN